MIMHLCFYILSFKLGFQIGSCNRTKINTAFDKNCELKVCRHSKYLYEWILNRYVSFRETNQHIIFVLNIFYM